MHCHFVGCQICPICSFTTRLILCTHRIDWLKLNKEKIGYMSPMKEAGFLLQLTACEILDKTLWNHEGSSDLFKRLLHTLAV